MIVLSAVDFRKDPEGYEEIATRETGIVTRADHAHQGNSPARFGGMACRTI